jgi:hypothetical protein
MGEKSTRILIDKTQLRITPGELRKVNKHARTPLVRAKVVHFLGVLAEIREAVQLFPSGESTNLQLFLYIERAETFPFHITTSS